FARQEFSEAADLFRKALDRNSVDPVLRYNLALALGGQGWKWIDDRNYNDALLNFDEALALKPDEASLYLGMGLAYYRMNEPERAEDRLKKVIALAPNMAEPYAILGDIQYTRDDIEMAVGYYERGLELDPSNQALRDHLAKARRENTVQSGFQQEATRAFTVKFEGREEQSTARRVLDDLEEAQREIGRDMSYYPQQSITVILYSDQQFRNVTDSPTWTSGLFDGKIRVPTSGSEFSSAHLRRVLFHEYTHALVHELTGGAPVPTWLNEGLAEFYENRSAAETSNRPPPQFRSGLPLIPLARLHGSFLGMSKPEADLAYLESYSAVLSLEKRYGMFRIRLMLEELGRKKRFEEAFFNQFMTPYGQFQSDWMTESAGDAP
ncbi:MAG TPA: tetratricopeptide repeat protein, partial [Nitrospiria bacterium]